MNTMKNGIKSTLSTLWIFIMFNMIFADVIGFMNTGFLEQMITMKPHEGLVLVVSLMVEIPIAMILCSRFLPYKANRLANLTAGLFTIAWVIGGGNTSLSYIFFATIEVTATLSIMWMAWKWVET